MRRTRAHELTARLGRPMVTTHWVLVKVVDALAAPERRESTAEFIEMLKADRAVEIIPASNRDFQRGLEFFRSRPDKYWSLTDCISFVVMQERGIREALTGDRHFEQAGFVALLK